LLAFWQQHAGAHWRAGASRHLTTCPAVSFEWRTVTASELHNTIRRWWLCLAAWTQPEGHFVRSKNGSQIALHSRRDYRFSYSL
jgi:hypothetical protein